MASDIYNASVTEKVGDNGRCPLLVFGGGAIGMSVAALLQKAAHPVVLIARPDRVKRIREQGIRLSGALGNHVAMPEIVASSIDQLTQRDFAVVLIAVKSFDTATAALACRDIISPSTVVVSLQNGMGNVEAITKNIGTDRVLGTTIMFGATVREPNQPHVNGWVDDIRIGGVGQPGLFSIANEISNLLTRAGLPTIPQEEMMPAIWSKLIVNACVSPLSAILQCTLGELGEDEHVIALMMEICEEALAVARVRGIGLPQPTSDAFLDHLLQNVIPAASSHRPCMVNDVRRGRQTEIDALNGYIADTGIRNGVSVPVNHTITRLIKAYLGRHNGLRDRTSAKHLRKSTTLV